MQDLRKILNIEVRIMLLNFHCNCKIDMELQEYCKEKID